MPTISRPLSSGAILTQVGCATMWSAGDYALPHFSILILISSKWPSFSFQLNLQLKVVAVFHPGAATTKTQGRIYILPFFLFPIANFNYFL